MNQKVFRKRPRHIESKTQTACVEWFDMQWSKYKIHLFAIPNGGKRDKVTAAIMKGEGVRPGVADLCLALPRNGYCGAYIEMKIKPNTPSENQIRFMETMKAVGYATALCYTLDEFMNFINDYMVDKRIADVEKVVCRVYGIDIHELHSKSQRRRVSEPRLVSMAIQMAYNIDTYAISAKYTLNRTTCYHARKFVIELYGNNKEFRSRLNLIISDLKLDEKMRIALTAKSIPYTRPDTAGGVGG